jgi:hypothetical protein
MHATYFFFEQDLITAAALYSFRKSVSASGSLVRVQDSLERGAALNINLTVGKQAPVQMVFLGHEDKGITFILIIIIYENINRFY